MIFIGKEENLFYICQFISTLVWLEKNIIEKLVKDGKETIQEQKSNEEFSEVKRTQNKLQRNQGQWKHQNQEER